MRLFDLPLDLFRKILQQVVFTLGSEQARKLRLVNSLMRNEIEEAIIATLPLNCQFTNNNNIPLDHEPGNIEFLATYVRACIKTKQRALKVYGGLLDVIESTTIQLGADPEINADLHFENVLLGVCRMALLSLGLGRVIQIIRLEEQNQKSRHHGDFECEAFRSAAYLLPAAIFFRMSSLTNRLLEEHPNLNIENGYFWSPLCAAAFTGQADLTQRLLDKGADPYFGPVYHPGRRYVGFEWIHITEHHLRYAPRAAAICGHDHVLEILFEKRNPSVVQRDTFKSFLMAAARSGRIETLERLGRYDPILFESQEVKHFLMYEACARGHTDMVKAMLKAGASVDLFDIAPYDPQSPYCNQPCLDPLKVAASFGRLATVKLLLDHGAPLQRSQERRRPTRITALGLAVTYGFRQVSELLVHHGADIYAGRLKPMNNACRDGQAHMVRFLLEQRCLLGKTECSKEYDPQEMWDYARLAIQKGIPSVAEVLREFGVPESLE
ncbi:MAG: hypothetical protein Q9160_005236 [Pyrenula sp. 1 TL-2023]